jgi:CheY-like chemotaxis protein
MIQRLIGEGIELTVVPDTAPATVLADRGQLEQILMNLCVNARDAMPDGGSLFIETQRVVCNELDCQMYENLKPGPYVLLTVRDTGCGMTHETMKQIFEPFFTTKGVGKGTGLGLATIYGIVQQNGAAISVTSEIDKGTVFRIWWPFSEQVASSPERIFAERAKGGKESILLAEDDDQVRKLARRILEAGGYRVLEAPNGEEALQIFKEHADEIRLLVFDVVMPAKGGRIAFEEIRAIKPSIKCLFASGYSEAAVHTNFILKEGLHLLEKPYEFNDLLRAVRKVLEG